MGTAGNEAGAVRRLGALPGGVWALGLVSMFMDISSEMVHSLLPVFLVSTLGLGYASVGVIEGVAEAIALVARPFSGVLSDRSRRRKPLAVTGYALAALTKPVFALAGSAGWIIAARCLDRLGKGIRGAPRDALVADITPPHLQGAGFGLRQSLDSVGAFIGPLLAIGLMIWLAGDIRGVFGFAVIPAVIAVLILLVAVREPPVPAAGDQPPAKQLHWRDARLLGADYWVVVALGALTSLAAFSDAFLVLRARDLGLDLTLLPLVLIAMNVVYALAAYPAGLLSDRYGRRGLLVAGFGAVIAANLLLAAAGRVTTALLGTALWGLHLGLTKGVLNAMVADTAPPSLRGTAFGVLSLVNGLALLLASVIAGWLWDRAGAPAPFLAGAVIAGLALAGWLVTGLRRGRRRRVADTSHSGVDND